MAVILDSSLNCDSEKLVSSFLRSSLIEMCCSSFCFFFVCDKQQTSSTLCPGRNVTEEKLLKVFENVLLPFKTRYVVLMGQKDRRRTAYLLHQFCQSNAAGWRHHFGNKLLYEIKNIQYSTNKLNYFNKYIKYKESSGFSSL